MKVNVDVDEILQTAQKFIDERLPEITIFEGSATSDPIPTEPYAHSYNARLGTGPDLA